MNILLAVYLLLQISVSYAGNTGVVSDDESPDAGNNRRQDAFDFDSHRSNRRFSESKDAIKNLQNIDQRQIGKCKLESFEDKVDKYKKPRAKDASFIEFVSSDAISVNEDDILAPCISINDTKDDKAAEGNNVTSLSPKKGFTVKMELDLNGTSENHEALTPNTATTANVKRDSSGTANDAKSEGIRRSEYQFSSVEYYDDTNDFDASKCPDAVEVIILQLDEIRKYDVECETMIEWRSLE